MGMFFCFLCGMGRRLYLSFSCDCCFWPTSLIENYMFSGRGEVGLFLD